MWARASACGRRTFLFLEREVIGDEETYEYQRVGIFVLLHVCSIFFGRKIRSSTCTCAGATERLI